MVDDIGLVCFILVDVHFGKDLLNDFIDELLRDAADVLLDVLINVLVSVIARLGHLVHGDVDHSIHAVRRHHSAALSHLGPNCLNKQPISLTEVLAGNERTLRYMRVGRTLACAVTRWQHFSARHDIAAFPIRFETTEL